jgi:hypothetical protein
LMGFGGQTLVADSVLPTMTVLMWNVYWKFNGPDFLDPPPPLPFYIGRYRCYLYMTSQKIDMWNITC